MARSRNIKPGFFQNDDLAEKNCPLGRIFFIGLWTIADYKGDLEWRPGRLKAQLLPYDDCDIKKIAINLDNSGFIRFYSDGETIFLNVVNFMKHQNPHKNEKQSGSDIPEFSEKMRQVVDLNNITIIRDLSRLNLEQDGTNPADSLLLIPDSLKPHPLKENSDSGESEKRKRFTPPTFEEVDGYMRELQKGSAAEAQKFVDFYESKGWMVGKNKMKSWQASVRTWLSKSAQNPQKVSGFNLQGLNYQSGDL